MLDGKVSQQTSIWSLNTEQQAKALVTHAHKILRQTHYNVSI
jgi:hypothetical protein